MPGYTKDNTKIERLEGGTGNGHMMTNDNGSDHRRGGALR